MNILDTNENRNNTIKEECSLECNDTSSSIL